MGDEAFIDSIVSNVSLELYDWSDVLLDGGGFMLQLFWEMCRWITRLRPVFMFARYVVLRSFCYCFFDLC